VRNWLFSLLSFISLTACADQGAPRFGESGVMPLSGTPVGFKCPSGIKQTFSDGGWVVWRGVDSRDKDICVGTNWHGYNVTAIRGIVRTSGYQAASLPYVRAAVATITNEPPGVVATYSARVTTVGTSANDAGNNNPILRDFAIKIAGTETLTTPAGTFTFAAIALIWSGVNPMPARSR